MKAIKFLEESGLLIKGISNTIEKESNEKKGWVLWYVIRCIRC